MSSDFIDMTLPANDPNFPKPRGLLPVPAELVEVVAQDAARIARDYNVHATQEAKQKMLDDLTLQYYYDGAYVASRRVPGGVEVLAVGWDEANRFRKEHPPETRQDVRIGMV